MFVHATSPCFLLYSFETAYADLCARPSACTAGCRSFYVRLNFACFQVPFFREKNKKTKKTNKQKKINYKIASVSLGTSSKPDVGMFHDQKKHLKAMQDKFGPEVMF